MHSAPNQVNPIFIVGMPRSGTTLLRTLLSAHPAIAIPPETHFLNHWMLRYQAADLTRPAIFNRFWDEFCKSDFMVRSGLDPDTAKGRIQSAGDINFKGIFTTLLLMYAEAKGKRRCAEKTPAHYQYMHVLLDWFPHGRLIFVQRDPRGVVASLLKVPWAPDFAYVSARNWTRSCSILEQCASDQRVLCLRYESLVEQTEHELKRVCEFVGEEFTSAMLERTGSDINDNIDVNDKMDESDKIINMWSKEHLRSAFRPVDSESVEKWRVTLSGYQIAVIEHIARKKMTGYGYQPITEGLSLPQRAQWCSEIIKNTVTRAGRVIRRPSLAAAKLKTGNRSFRRP